MRNKNQKSRCTKQMLPKFEEICKTYDKVQNAGALLLSGDKDIASIRCNVPLELDFEDGNRYMTDFVFTKKNGELAVRECVFRKLLDKPKTMKLLDASRNFWLSRGVSDWGLIVDADASTQESKLIGGVTDE